MADVVVEQSVEVSEVGAKRRRTLASGNSQDKLKHVLGVDDQGLTKALGDGSMVWQEVEERVVESGREVAIRRAQKNRKAQQILGIDRSTRALMNKLGISEEELVSALRAEAELQSAANRAQIDRDVVKSNRTFTKALERLGIDPIRFILQKRLGLEGRELDEAVLQTQLAAMEQQLHLEEDEYFHEHPMVTTDLSLDEPSSLSDEAERPHCGRSLSPEARVALRSSEKLRHIFGLDEGTWNDIDDGEMTDEDVDDCFLAERWPEDGS